MATIARSRILTALALLLLAFSTQAHAAEGFAAAPRAGFFDLSALPEGRVATLDGEWQFWWRQFLTPADFASGKVGEPIVVPFPGEWHRYGRGLPTTGYATYRLRVSGLDPSRDWGLRMGSFLSAATVWANGEVVMEFGRPGADAASESPGWASKVAILHPAADGSVDLVIQLSNYSDWAGGLRTHMYLGDYAEIEGARDRLRLFELFSIGVLVAMGLYYLFLHGFRPKERSSLFFGLLCISLAVRISCYDEYFILDLFPRMPWHWLFRLGYLMFSVPVGLTTGFIAALFPKRSWKPVIWTVFAVSAAYSAIILFAPPLFFSSLLHYFQYFTGVVGLYLVVVLVLALANREKGSFLFLLGFLAFFASTVFDILVANGMIKGSFVAQYGLLVFLFAMSIVITEKLAGAWSLTEALSEELSRANRAMKRFVPEKFLSLLGKSSIEQVALGDHAREDMSVMFADIRSFSGISERLSPEETFRFINQYLARMGPTVRDNHGFVDKYMGDGIMALFPGSPEDAARCAIDMQMRLGEYNEQRAVLGEPAIRIGIGIHFGGIMLGTIGENERMDGTVIADAVNVASRMESVSKEFGVGVVAGESVLSALYDPSEYRTRYLGKVGVKGRREPIAVYELYDGDPEELRAQKDAIKEPFEAAIGAFYDQEYARAFALFQQVASRLPDDDATQYYLRIIRKLNLS